MKRFISVALLASTFFLFVDNIFRGWEDTNQYQLEALAWAQGLRPPSPLMSQETQGEGIIMPKYYGVLTAYTWSFFTDPDDVRGTLFRIKLFQAAMVWLIFAGFIFAIDRKMSWGVIGAAIFLFFNPFCRELVITPLSETMALLLLVLAFLFPSASSTLAALELMTRPVMGLLFFPVLWKKRRDPKIYVFGILTLLVGHFYFKELMFPSNIVIWSRFNWEWEKIVFTDFINTSAFQLFNHLLPHEHSTFVFAWGLVLGLFVLFLFSKTWRRWDVWIPSILCMLVSSIWGTTGVRYFFPVIVLWFLCFYKPGSFKNFFSFSKNTRVLATTIMCLFLAHLIIRQIDSGLETQRDKLPETERGFVDIKKWLADNGHQKDVLMVYRFRFCANYFQTVCFALPTNTTQFIEKIKKYNVRFVIFPNKEWQRDDNELQQKILQLLSTQRFNITQNSKDFSGITILDVSSIASKSHDTATP